MQEEELSELISKTAALMEQFERRCEAIDQRLVATSDALQALTRQLPRVVEQAVASTMRVLPSQISKQVNDGLSKPVAEYQARLDESGSEIGRVSHSLAQQIKHMERLQQMLIWKVVGVTATCFLLLLFGGIWLSTYYTRVIEENQIAANLMRTYNGADVVLCERNQLCANVDIKGKRYGDHKQYLPVTGR